MTGLIGAAADLISTLITILADLAMGVGAFVLLCWVICGVLLWTARRHRNRHLAEDVTAMLDRWMDEPGIIPDALDRDLARLLEEGDGRG